MTTVADVVPFCRQDTVASVIVVNIPSLSAFMLQKLKVVCQKLGAGAEGKTKCLLGSNTEDEAHILLQP